MSQHKIIHPRITLVGAGPGDPELFTIKGIRALQQADVVLYDALANPELLDYAPAHARKIPVGKRAGKHSVPQEKINALMISEAIHHGHVVRLKGGDPFVFGRGYEELEYAESRGIPVAIVPGLSSSIAVPELQRIPLTKRGDNESFWVITGTTKSGKLSNDLKLAAQSTATVIILMGMQHLGEIRDLFLKNGKGETPFAIIQNGSLPNEKVGTGKVKNMVNTAARKKLGSPAIIVIGEVAKYHASFITRKKQEDVLLAIQN
jgi:uroporphyrin-III C-methyltransferase